MVDSRSTARKAVRRTLQMLGQVKAAPSSASYSNGIVTDAGSFRYSYSYGQTFQPESPRLTLFGHTPTPTRP